MKVLLAVALCGIVAAAQVSPPRPIKQLDQYRVDRFEIAGFSQKGGQWVEQPKVLASLSRYNESDRLVEVTSFKPDRSILLKYTPRYDSGGLLVEETYSSNNGAVEARFVVNRGAGGRIIEFTRHNSKGVVSTRVVLTYGSDGALLNRATYDNRGAVESKTTYSYDSPNRMASCITFDRKGAAISQSDRIYTLWGDVLEEEDSDARFYGRTRIKYYYDSQGNKTLEEIQSPYGPTVLKYSHEYDQMGNWTKRTIAQVTGNSVQPLQSSYRTPAANTGKPRAPLKTVPLIECVVDDETRVVYTEMEAIRRVEPPYPAEAKSQRLSGSALVTVFIDETGLVITAWGRFGNKLFVRPSIDAALRWRFSQTLEQGMLIKARGDIKFNYQM
ncbi:MAG TPA: energy transducer TonB [Blastocatellia bacterium]|nr:energy transducer TonB [Blastocatellia bacterium]